MLAAFQTRQNVFCDEGRCGKSWGVAIHLDYTRNTPLIVAAVECSTSPNNGV